MPLNSEIFCAPFEIKLAGSDGVFTGHASMFDVIDDQRDIVAKGAFANSLSEAKQANRMPAMLWMHNPGQPIGVWDMVSEDEKGLSVSGRLATKTQAGAEAYELAKMGAVSGLSIGYRTLKSTPDPARKARVLNEVKLYEISLVTFPANDSARISAVKSAELLKNPREFERALRDAMGLSSREAKAFMAGGFKSLSACDGPESASEALTAGARDERHGLNELAQALKSFNASMQQSA